MLWTCGNEMSGGDIKIKRSISKPVNKNINTVAGIIYGNFLSFQMKIRLPIIPLSTVEMADGMAVLPPKDNLYAADIIPTGIPTTGPPKRPLIITIKDLMLAGAPLMFTKAYEEKTPTDANIIKHIS